MAFRRVGRRLGKLVRRVATQLSSSDSSDRSDEWHEWIVAIPIIGIILIVIFWNYLAQRKRSSPQGRCSDSATSHFIPKYVSGNRYKYNPGPQGFGIVPKGELLV